MEGKPRFRIFVVYIAILMAFLGLIGMVFQLHSSFFVFEFLILMVLLLVALISFMGLNNNMNWVWKLLATFFGFVFINMAFLYLVLNIRPDYFFEHLFAVIAGFFISLFSIKKPRAVEGKDVETSFSPGKYIASRTGAKFHAPKCDWAKKIKKENAVWFNNSEDARKSGYKADDCVH